MSFGTHRTGAIMSSRYLKSGNLEMEIDKLHQKIQSLEKRINQLEGGDAPNPWSQYLIPYGNPSLPMTGKWTFEPSNSAGIVINCSLDYMESLPKEIMDEIFRRENPEEAYSTCVAVRFQLREKEKGAYQHDLLQQANDWWTAWTSADDDIHTLKSSYSPLRWESFSDESDLQRAMDEMFEQSSLYQRNVVTMVCRMSIKLGSYIRLHLSKGWSHYLQHWMTDAVKQNHVKMDLPGNYSFDVAAINPRLSVEGMSMKMRVEFKTGGDGLRVKLPSWFKPLSRDNQFEGKRLFYGKVTRVFESHDDPRRAKSWTINNGITALWNRRKGTKGHLRNELRCVGREFSDIPLPSEGMFDLELQL